MSALASTNYATIEKHYLSFLPNHGMRAVEGLQVDDIA
jgi:hypothetical protein